MALLKLYKAKAFEPGHELWISSGRPDCLLTKDINWYSNFLMSRSLKHQMPELGQDLDQLLKQYQLEILKPQALEQPNYLLETSKYLPNKYVLVNNFKNLDSWIKESLKVWEQLQKPSLRFFLPPEISNDEFEKHWPKTNYLMEVSLVSQ